MFAGPILARGLAALLTIQPASGAPQGESAAPAASPGARFDEAVELGRRRQHAEAAAAFEALRADTKLPRYRLQAGQAREAAGHVAHAVEQWQALLSEDTGMSAGRRADVQAKIAAARKKLGGLELRASVEDRASAVVVTLRRADGRPPLTRTIAVKDGGGSLGVELDPGAWDVEATAPGYVAATRTIEVPRPGKTSAAVQPVELALVRDRREVAFTVGPAAAIEAGVTVTLRAGEGVQEAEEKRTRVVERAAAEETLALAPGRWEVTLEAPGFVTRELTWEVGEQPLADGQVELEEVKAPAPAPAPAPVRRPSPDVRLGLGLGLGLGGGLAFGTGVGLVIRHRLIYPNFTPAPDNADYVAAVGATDVGAALIGGGLGLGATALTAGLGARDRVLWGEFTGGGVLAIAGVAWYVTDWQRVQRMLYDGGKAEGEADLAPLRRETAAASFIGAGVGLVVGSGVALLTRLLVARRAARHAGRLRLEAGAAGLVGRF